MSDLVKPEQIEWAVYVGVYKAREARKRLQGPISPVAIEKSLRSFLSTPVQRIRKGAAAEVGEQRDWADGRYEKQPDGSWAQVTDGGEDDSAEEEIDVFTADKMDFEIYNLATTAENTLAKADAETFEFYNEIRTLADQSSDALLEWHDAILAEISAADGEPGEVTQLQAHAFRSIVADKTARKYQPKVRAAVMQRVTKNLSEPEETSMERLKEQLEKSGQSDEKVGEVLEMVDRAKTYVKKSWVGQRVPLDMAVLESIRRSNGRLKTVYETGESMGAPSPSRRATWENSIVREPQSLSEESVSELAGVGIDNKERPTYGMRFPLGYGPGDWSSGKQYGEIVIKYADEVAERTTMTLGDSCEMQGGFTRENVTLGFVRPEEGSGFGDNRTYARKLESIYADNEYMECQMWGGAHLGEAMEVFIPKPYPGDEEEEKAAAYAAETIEMVAPHVVVRYY